MGVHTHQILTCKLCGNEFYSFLIDKNTTKNNGLSIINISRVPIVLRKGCVYNIRKELSVLRSTPNRSCDAGLNPKF